MHEKQVYDLIEKGTERRKVGVSDVNEHSSRSHSIFRLIIESAVKVDEAADAADAADAAAAAAAAGAGAGAPVAEAGRRKGQPSPALKPKQNLSGAVKVSELFCFILLRHS